MARRFPPVRWTPAPSEPPVPSVTGGAGLLDAVERFPLPGRGPEDVLVDDDGTVLTGLADGRLVRLDPADGSTRQVGHTGGRPLGLEWLPDGRVLVCDAYAGLLAVHLATDAVEVLCEEVDGERLVLTNNAAVEPDGTIWFTESSRTRTLADYVDDLVEHNDSGRLLRRDVDGTVETVLAGLTFANGVALVGDDVWVAETGGYALHRVGRHGPGAGEAEVLTDRLPGFPDNLSVGADGTVWAPLPNGRLPAADRLVGMPAWVKALVIALPDALGPRPTAHAEVLGLAPDGTVRHHLTGSGEHCTFLTGAREHDGWLWLGSESSEVTDLVRVRVPGVTG